MWGGHGILCPPVWKSGGTCPPCPPQNCAHVHDTDQTNINHFRTGAEPDIFICENFKVGMDVVWHQLLGAGGPFETWVNFESLLHSMFACDGRFVFKQMSFYVTALQMLGLSK